MLVESSVYRVFWEINLFPLVNRREEKESAGLEQKLDLPIRLVFGSPIEFLPSVGTSGAVAKRIPVEESYGENRRIPRKNENGLGDVFQDKSFKK